MTQASDVLERDFNLSHTGWVGRFPKSQKLVLSFFRILYPHLTRVLSLRFPRSESQSFL